MRPRSAASKIEITTKKEEHGVMGIENRNQTRRGRRPGTARRLGAFAVSLLLVANSLAEPTWALAEALMQPAPAVQEVVTVQPVDDGAADAEGATSEEAAAEMTAEEAEGAAAQPAAAAAAEEADPGEVVARVEAPDSAWSGALYLKVAYVVGNQWWQGDQSAVVKLDVVDGVASLTRGELRSALPLNDGNVLMGDPVIEGVYELREGRTYQPNNFQEPDYRELHKDSVVADTLHITDLEISGEHVRITGTRYVFATPAYGVKKLDLADILGDARYFGIVADVWDQFESETNAAVGELVASQQTGNDLTAGASGSTDDQPFVIGSIADGTSLLVKGRPADMYLPEAHWGQVRHEKGTSEALRLHGITSNEAAEYVAGLKATPTEVLKDLPSSSLTVTPECPQTGSQKYCLDFTGSGPGTFVVDIDVMDPDPFGEAEKMVLKMDPATQTVVFRSERETVSLHKFRVVTPTGSVPTDTTNASGEAVAASVAFWLPNAKKVDIVGSILGMVVAPEAHVQIGSTSAGWLVAEHVANDGGQEWHNIWQSVDQDYPKPGDEPEEKPGDDDKDPEDPGDEPEEKPDLTPGPEEPDTPEAQNLVSLGAYSLPRAHAMEASKVCYVDPKVTKVLEGRPLKAGEFTFQLIDSASGEVVSTASNDGLGLVDFDAAANKAPAGMEPSCLLFTQPGSYDYLVREVTEDPDPTVEYSTQEVHFFVKVEEAADGALRVARDEAGNELMYYYENSDPGNPVDPLDFADPDRHIPADEHPVIVNRVAGEVSLRLRKTDATDPDKGLPGAVYELCLRAPGGEQGFVPVAQATSDEDGWMDFSDLDLLEGERYFFREAQAPVGYELDEEATPEFVIDGDGDGSDGLAWAVEYGDGTESGRTVSSAGVDPVTQRPVYTLVYEPGVQDAPLPAVEKPAATPTTPDAPAGDEVVTVRKTVRTVEAATEAPVGAEAPVEVLEDEAVPLTGQVPRTGDPVAVASLIPLGAGTVLASATAFKLHRRRTR